MAIHVSSSGVEKPVTIALIQPGETRIKIQRLENPDRTVALVEEVVAADSGRNELTQVRVVVTKEVDDIYLTFSSIRGDASWKEVIFLVNANGDYEFGYNPDHLEDRGYYPIVKMGQAIGIGKKVQRSLEKHLK